MQVFSEDSPLCFKFVLCPLKASICPLFSVRGFTLDRMDLGSEPKKKRRHKKLATKVSFKVENFLSSTISEKIWSPYLCRIQKKYLILRNKVTIKIHKCGMLTFRNFIN